MNELGRLLDEATGALARMDAEALTLLEVRASGLIPAVPSEEVVARFRVFASVLQGTGRGLDVLRRVHGCAGTGGEDSWVR